MIETAVSLVDSSRAFRSQGADVSAGGVWYRTWCKHDRVEAIIRNPKGDLLRSVSLQPEGDGFYTGFDEEGRDGDLYKYCFGESQPWPDPASRYQPLGVHGPSAVVDPGTYSWRDETWMPHALTDLIIYELHVGTFTKEGTFRSAIERLAHVASLGVTAIELMPIADFAGKRNWGYDGVMLYAPARAYGAPDDLRALVDAAHELGLTVVLDVVYNHFGPDGNYAGVFHHGYYSKASRETPWGTALDYAAAPVRAFFVENALYWMREFHIDGFRLDATHTIEDDSECHILAEIASAVHALGGFIVAEDERNDPKLLMPPERGGLGFDAVWADDFHHIVRVFLTEEQESYYANFEGNSMELAQTLAQGWLFRGQVQKTNARPRGGDPASLGLQQFIFCISNHDQVGNRAFGERLSHVISAAAYRAASALLCLVPQTPMLFMGQEWAASTPFQFFTDHKTNLGKSITEGRRREFQDFAAFRDAAPLETIPDPQAQTTFFNSKLCWEEMHQPAHAGILLLYREFLQLRQTHPGFRDRSRDNCLVLQLGDGVVVIVFGRAGEFNCALVSDLRGGHEMPNLDDERFAPGRGRDWRPLLSSNETRFGGGAVPPFRIPTTLVLESV